MSYFRENIEKMVGYVPGEQPAAGERVIKLNTNENPYPPSPKALEILQNLDGEALRRYPDPSATQFRKVVAEVLGLPLDWIIAGNGSDEILTMILRACVGPDDTVAYAVPTYVLYRTLTQIQAGRCVEIPYGEDFALPADALADASAVVTFVASPNSPSGTTYSIEQLDVLAGRLEGVLVVDEAYVDFADGDCLEIVRGDPRADARPSGRLSGHRRENVIILRTLSKGYSLAGLRLGFGVADPAVLEGLWKVKDSYNVDAVAAAVGSAAFADQDHKNANAEMVKDSRAKLAEQLTDLGFRVWPSQANFLLTRPPDGDAERLYQGLKAGGILVRYFNQQGLDDKLRITVGTDEQNAALVASLRRLRGKG
ncbi:MAG: histidinol-phosphate transaminase [Planctomycetota bacterium]|nr:histidinol-phosphate transaminase [Planctomycetota bacterium]